MLVFVVLIIRVDIAKYVLFLRLNYTNFVSVFNIKNEFNVDVKRFLTL